MRQQICPDFGFEGMVAEERSASADKIQSIGMNEVRRKFSPEFVNRINAVIAYQPLMRESVMAILGQQLSALERHIQNRLEERLSTWRSESRRAPGCCARGLAPNMVHAS